MADRRTTLVLVFAALALALAACGNEAPRGPGPLAIAPLDAAADASADAAKKPVGDPCTQDDECEAGACFKGATRAYCTKRCAPTTAAEDCPIPPYTAVCNMQGFCKL